MATKLATTFARDASTTPYIAECIERERTSVAICRRNYVNVLADLHRELGYVLTDPYRHWTWEPRIGRLVEHATDAECHLSLARSRLAEAEAEECV